MERAFPWLVGLLVVFPFASAGAVEPSDLLLAPIAAAVQADGNAPASSCLAPVVDPKLKVLGARSCAASACHGNVEPDTRGGVRRNEYIVWLEKDPHADAFESLQAPLGLQILDNLGIRKEDAIVDRAAYRECLACHSLEPSTEFEGESFVIHDGVSCESCHGPAEKWRALHYRTDWDPKKAASLGRIDTKNLLTRAYVCASCHVGSSTRQVTHDMLAAGHPPLRFELSSYLDMMPKHWRDSRERKAQTNFELAVWRAGQIASAEAALAVLESRAVGALSDSERAVWPEFAQFDCFACHHELSSPSWRQQRGYADRSPGSPAWGTWYFTALPSLAGEASSGPAAARLTGSLADLRKTMNGRAAFDPKVAGGQAAATRQSLCDWATARREGDASRDLVLAATDIVSKLVAPDAADASSEPPALENWETATQAYLIAAAIDRAYRDEAGKSNRALTAADRQTTESVKRLRELLAFPDGYSSPRNFGAGSDGGSQRDEFHAAMIEVVKQLKARQER